MAAQTQHTNARRNYGKSITAAHTAWRVLVCSMLATCAAACSSPEDTLPSTAPGVTASSTDVMNTVPSGTSTAPTDTGSAPTGSTTPTEPAGSTPGPSNTVDPEPTQSMASTGPAVSSPGVEPTSSSAEPDPTGPETNPSAPREYPVPESLPEEDGSQLWLRYRQVPLEDLRAEYRTRFSAVVDPGADATLQAAAAELVLGLSGLTGADVTKVDAPSDQGLVMLGTPSTSEVIAALQLDLSALGSEGYLVLTLQGNGDSVTTIVVANEPIGVLYGSFALLRHLQSHLPTGELELQGAPKVQNRILDHWDNLDGSIERGYAGRSLWAWDELPGTLSPRYKAYARANASIGVNGVVLNNVNANAQILTATYLQKVAALAEVFRPYGIKVYLTARFSAPLTSEIGSSNTADPLDAGVKQWWLDKADEIYALIPDFGGFLVKANSEGQPGPQDYGRTHADGANTLADALAPHGGIVMWRAFVYSDSSPVDRIRQAYDEFQPLDGAFQSNVLVQVKNGPLDFQPREPFSPLFGAMPQTPLALELQITKEYLGEDTHLAYLGPLYEEVLQADTFAQGEGSSVARVIDGSLHGYRTTVMAGVANVGSDTNWSGSHFNQANWYVFGRLAWDPDASSAAIAEEWVRQTLSNDPVVLQPVVELMLNSRQALVDYMTPLGLAHIMGTDHHYGPKPWENSLSRAEWNPTYYHKANADGIGFDRTPSGSDAVAQYAEPVRERFASRQSVPDDLLLFFHNVGWQETLGSGRTLWDELVFRYSRGVDAVGLMRQAWQGVEGRVDAQRFVEVSEFLEIQHYEARWWRDACLTYFQGVAAQEISEDYAPPANGSDFYRGLSCPSDPTKPRCDAVYTGEPSPVLLQPEN